MKDHLKENIRFIVKTEMLSGKGIAKNLPEHLKAHSWRKIGLVIDQGVHEHNAYVPEIIDLLKKDLEQVVVFISDLPEPTYGYLEDTKRQFEEHPLDCFVGIGGGSTLDLTKGFATLQTNEGAAISFRGFGKVTIPPLPVVALPTTAGTGSEVTPYAVFIDTKAQWKFGINSEYNYPKLALYDPTFLDSCPLSVYASAGMDAMTHTLESFAAKNATFLSKMYSKQAFKLLFENLHKIAEGERSAETKLNLLVGSGCAGIALMNAGAGPAGALSYPLGVYFDVPHGLAGSVFLPKVIEYTCKNGFEDYAELYDLAFQTASLSAVEKSLRFAEEIKKLSDKLAIPTNLKGFGVKTDDDLKLIIEGAWQLRAAFEQNPVIFGQKEIEETVYALR